jgi:uncharacterized protein (DUF486 family)
LQRSPSAACAEAHRDPLKRLTDHSAINGHPADRLARRNSKDTGCMPSFPTSILPIVLLLASNVFMTFAWYGHLKYTDRPLWLVVIVSWSIAFIEYCLAVPANRYGSAVYSPAQLKTMQEVITLVVFAGFSVLFLKTSFTLNHLVGFALIAAGAFFVFKGPL